MFYNHFMKESPNLFFESYNGISALKKWHLGKRDKSDSNAIEVTNAICNLFIAENNMVYAKGRDYAATENT